MLCKKIKIEVLRMGLIDSLVAKQREQQAAAQQQAQVKLANNLVNEALANQYQHPVLPQDSLAYAANRGYTRNLFNTPSIAAPNQPPNFNTGYNYG